MPTLLKLKDELVLAVRRKDFVKAEEITVKIVKIENEANELYTGKKIFKSNLSQKYIPNLFHEYVYRKVASSRPVYYSIFDYFWGATN